MTPSTTGWSYTISILAASTLATSISNLSVAIICAAIVMLFILVAAAIAARDRNSRFKAPLFTLIVSVVITATLALSGANIALSLNSSTGGPVRWTADFEMWACGNQLDLRDPRGLLTDRIGSPVLFEQNDGRIHFNGMPNLPDDASLGAFMRAVGGDMTDDSLIYPVNNTNGFVGTPLAPEQVQPYMHTNSEGTYVRFLNGQSCGDQKSEVQAFVYRTDATSVYRQTKIDHPGSYEISHEYHVPPGDCIIMEFAPPMDHTDHVCKSLEGLVQ